MPSYALVVTSVVGGGYPVLACGDGWTVGVDRMALVRRLNT